MARGVGRRGPGHARPVQHERQVPRQWDGRSEANGRQAIGSSWGVLTCKLHVVAARTCTPLAPSLSSGQAADGPVGHPLLRALGPVSGRPALLMDRAYRDDHTHRLAIALG